MAGALVGVVVEVGAAWGALGAAVGAFGVVVLGDPDVGAIVPADVQV